MRTGSALAHPRDFIRFLLNDDVVSCADVSPYDTLLEYLRLRARLTGTKEGCAEGDCGACTVLVGRLDPVRGLVYETVNACIRFLASLDGCHVVTVEYLSKTSSPHPLQEAMVRRHGAQCGFCTPGIVMSLYGLWMEKPEPSDEDVRKSLQGNLCRCTGYAPIVRAAQNLQADPEQDRLLVEREAIYKQLCAWHDGTHVALSHSDGETFVPATLDEFAAVREVKPDATIVSGATDVGLWVTKTMRKIAPVIHLAKVDDLRRVDVGDSEIRIGATVSYDQFTDVLASEIPQLLPLWDRIGGAQIRNMGTIGGNIANGSPIGDTPPPLITLGARLILRKGAERRSLPLEDYFLSYGKQDLSAGEFIEHIEIPKPSGQFSVHKVSKRRDEDISTLCGAFHLRIEDGTVKDVRIAFGGMAQVPSRAKSLENALLNARWSIETIEACKSELEKDYTPISDARASAAYRMLAAKNLLERFYLETGQGVP